MKLLKEINENISLEEYIDDVLQKLNVEQVNDIILDMIETAYNEDVSTETIANNLKQYFNNNEQNDNDDTESQNHHLSQYLNKNNQVSHNNINQ